MTDLNTCRACGKAGYESKCPMIKYSVRHYAHADCALAKWGAAFFDHLTEWQLTQFPALVAIEAGLETELMAAMNKRHYRKPRCTSLLS